MTTAADAKRTPHVVGRYRVFEAIASGGMASVHLGRLLGEVGFARTVAIKRLHPHFAAERQFVAMFVDEARLAARIHHPNVVQTLDVVSTEDELFIVMEYVQGEALSRLLGGKRGGKSVVPPPLASAIAAGVLRGLHAAHEARNEDGEPLDIVHRDVSPQNVLVGVDGVARILDFGVAKARVRLQTTGDGGLKGKLAYMAPEQLRGGAVSRRTDVYAAAIVLWEMLTGRRLFVADDEGALVEQVLTGCLHPPSRWVEGLPPALDDVVLDGLAHDPCKRFADAAEMARALEAAVPPASSTALGDWVRERAGETLSRRALRIAEIESSSRTRMQPGELRLSSGGRGAERAGASDGAHVDSKVTTTSDVGAAGPRSRRRAVGAALAMPIAVVLTWLMFNRAPPHPTEIASTPANAGAASILVTASSTPVVGGASTTAATTATSAAGAPGATASSAIRPHAGGKHAAPRPTGAAPRPGCAPPYVRDEQGKIHWKAECL